MDKEPIFQILCLVWFFPSVQLESDNFRLTGGIMGLFYWGIGIVLGIHDCCFLDDLGINLN